MKTLKSYISSLILIAIALIAGCSDDLTSPVTTGIENKSVSRIEKETTYIATLKLGANETVILDSSVTSLDVIISFEISNCGEGPVRDFFISSSSYSGNMTLPCSMRVPNIMEFHDISIRNVSGQTKSFKVTLRGTTGN